MARKGFKDQEVDMASKENLEARGSVAFEVFMEKKVIWGNRDLEEFLVPQDLKACQGQSGPQENGDLWVLMGHEG